MSNSEIIHDFVDGTLGQDREDELFQVLGSSQAARNELKELMAIKSAVQTDSEAFIPSAKSTMAIFGALGFQAPLPAPVPVSNMVKFKSWLSKYSQAITGGFVASGLTAAVIFMLFNPFANVNNTISKDQFASNNKMTSKYVVPTSSASAETSLESKNKLSSANGNNSSLGNNNQVTASTNNTRVIVKYVYIPVDRNTQRNDQLANTTPTDDQNKNINALATEPSASSQPVIDINNSSMAINNSFSNGKHINTTTPLPIIPILQSIVGKDGIPIGLKLELGGSQYWFAFNDRINPAQRQSLNNSNIALMYDLSDEFAIGLDYRRESFYQKYDGIELTRQGVAQVKYEQEPNFQTASVSLRYSPEFARISIFSPFSQLAAGLNKAGVVGRIMIGTDLNIYSNYHFTVGYDYSTLRFMHQSNWFNTQKSGLHIGAGIKF